MNKWRILVVERERGWAGDSWYNYYDTEAEALAAIAEINSHNTATHAPDYYIQAASRPEQVYVGKHAKT
jgi:hypothetical protein